MTNPIFKIRASAVSQIMADPKTIKQKEAGEISQGAKTYLENWVRSEVYERRENIEISATRKGTEMEAAAIEKINSHLGIELKKNAEWRQDDHFTGECDCISDDAIWDVKNSFTFAQQPIFEMQPEKKYLEQGQVYLELFGKENFTLARVFCTSPLWILEKELKTAMYQIKAQYGGDLIEELYREKAAEIFCLHTARIEDWDINSIPVECRGAMFLKPLEIKDCISTYTCPKDSVFIENARKKVELCRQFLKKNGY